MQTVNRKALLVAACGAAVCASALAGPKVVNISGATLLESFVAAPASTNDYFDVDGNGVAGVFSSFPPQNLTPVPGVNQVSPFPANQIWATTYRLTGSVRGVTELASFGNTFVTNGASGSQLLFSNASRSYYNGAFLYQNGSNLATQPVTFNSANPGGMPIRSDTTTLDATYSVPGVASAGGVRIDIAPCDVPGLWVGRVAGTTAASKKPGQTGYGAFSRTATNAAGTGTGIDSRLPDLSALGVQFANPSSLPAPSATGFLFNNPFAFAPIAAAVNFGVGRQQIKQSELRHLFVTGRLPDGENLIAVTRDIGSGTRNAMMNSIAADPSFGGGDNVSNGTGTSATTTENRPGLAFVPNNKGGNDRVEETVYSTRLAIGYVGPERGAASASISGGTGNWLANGRMEVLAVQNDLQGGTVFARPNIDSITEGDVNNYVIGGPAQLITLGSPLAEAIVDGGLGLNTVKMLNPHAADYMNNIRLSIANFISSPSGPQSEFMPGEIAALQFVLTSAIANIHDEIDPTARVANSNFNSLLRTSTRATNALAESIFFSFNTTSSGIVPSRIVAASTYSDQGLVPSGANYISQGGAAVAYGTSLTSRNKIAGDFDGNGSRGLGDIEHMIRAFNQRAGGGAWTAPGVNGSDAVIEILGDFDNNGSFNKLDVRYFADGLLLVGGVLRRDTAFTEVDNQAAALCPTCIGTNFFNTTLATAGAGATYTAGASRADIKGAAGIARGWAPVGADGVINDKDIDYIYAQFKSNSRITGDADWSDINEAAFFDLSADMDGNLTVNQADVDYVVQTALQTSYGDLNFDRKVNGADFVIWAANYNTGSATTPAGWAKGDVSGDGKVFDEDFHTLMANRSCASDINDDTFTDDADFVLFATAYNDLLCPALPGLCPADLNDDGFVDDADFVIFADGYNALLCP
jgi:hypothetical protein